MNNLTKFQKIIILISIFWEVFVYCFNLSYLNKLYFNGFILGSIPVIIYWSVVWVLGFGYFEGLFKKMLIVRIITFIIAFALIICAINTGYKNNIISKDIAWVMAIIAFIGTFMGMFKKFKREKKENTDIFKKFINEETEKIAEEMLKTCNVDLDILDKIKKDNPEKYNKFIKKIVADALNRNLRKIENDITKYQNKDNLSKKE